MSKTVLAKKIVLSLLAILYDIVSLFWSYVLVRNLIYNFSTITVGKNGFKITVRENILAFVFEIGNIWGQFSPSYF